MTCQAEAVPGKYFRGQLAMPIKKDFEFYELFNLMILRMRESGLHDYTFKHYAKKRYAQSECSRRDKGDPLNMEAVISAFVVYVAGFCLSFALLFIEIFLKKIILH